MALLGYSTQCLASGQCALLVHAGLNILRFSFFEKLPGDPDTQLQLKWNSAGASFSFLESVERRKAASVTSAQTVVRGQEWWMGREARISQKLRACSPAVSEPTPGPCPAAGRTTQKPRNRENRCRHSPGSPLPVCGVAEQGPILCTALGAAVALWCSGSTGAPSALPLAAWALVAAVPPAVRRLPQRQRRPLRLYH
jgi:hypothetical protein